MDRAEYERLKHAIEQDYLRQCEALEIVRELSERYPAHAAEEEVPQGEAEEEGAEAQPMEEQDPSHEPPAQLRRRGRPPKPLRDDGRKVCTGCGEWKSPEEYHRKATSSDGRAPVCKECRKQAASEESERRLCANGPRCVATDPTDPFPQPAILDAANPGEQCRGCLKRAGVAP